MVAFLPHSLSQAKMEKGNVYEFEFVYEQIYWNEGWWKIFQIKLNVSFYTWSEKIKIEQSQDWPYRRRLDFFFSVEISEGLALPPLWATTKCKMVTAMPSPVRFSL